MKKGVVAALMVIWQFMIVAAAILIGAGLVVQKNHQETLWYILLCIVIGICFSAYIILNIKSPPQRWLLKIVK